MRILFSVQTLAQVRHFTSLLQALSRRGDQISIVATKVGPQTAPPYLEGIDGLRYLQWPSADQSFWSIHSDAFRMARNAAFYRQDCFGHVGEVKDRIDRALDGQFAALVADTEQAERYFARVEACIPPERGILDLIRAESPDLVLITPLVNHLTGAHFDFVKAARSLGIPVGLPTFSWDNLSCKGAMHLPPDRTYVWNSTQADEALQLHNLPLSTVSMHGAWRFDSYRTRSPTIDRMEYCERFGLDPRERIILYLGSSPMIAPNEGEFAADWLAAVRGSTDPVVARSNIVIRAHPRNFEAWQRDVIGDWPHNVTFQDPNSISFYDEQDLFDTIHHADACFGINTSALLEASLQRKPILTIRDPKVAAGQEGTPHFAYLTSVGGGVFYLSDLFQDHLADLGKCLRRPVGEPDERADRFTKAFLDPPHGNAECTDDLVAAIDKTAQLRIEPKTRSAADILYDLRIRALVSFGFLPITPVINPQLNSMPGKLGGRSLPASIRQPLTLPAFRPLWRFRFRGLRNTLEDVLQKREKPNYATIVIIAEMDRHLNKNGSNRVLNRLVKLGPDKLDPKNAKVAPLIAKERKRNRRFLRWIASTGGAKFLIETVFTDLEEALDSYKRNRAKK